MKIYISLPITGYDLRERKQYAESVKKRLQQIYTDSEIITPFDVNPDPTLPYDELMKRCLVALNNCDAVYFCKGWKESRGCMIEQEAAIAHCKYVLLRTYYQDLLIDIEP